MTGFHRSQQPSSLDRLAVKSVVTRIVADLSAEASAQAEELAFVRRTADPFGLVADCLNPNGHDFIAACGEIVCQHCTRIAWR